MSSVQERSGGRREAGPVALRQSDYTHTNNSQAGPGGILSCLGFFLICSLAFIYLFRPKAYIGLTKIQKFPYF